MIISKWTVNSDYVKIKNPLPRLLNQILILGRDFLIQNHITVQYADDGKCILDYQQQELVASLDVEDKPQLNLAYSVTLTRRSLAIVCIHNNLDPD